MERRGINAELQALNKELGVDNESSVDEKISLSNRLRERLVNEKGAIPKNGAKRVQSGVHLGTERCQAWIRRNGGK